MNRHNLFLKVLEKSGLTDAEVARITGISKQNISGWRNKVRTPSFDSICAIAKKLNVKLTVLVG